MNKQKGNSNSTLLVLILLAIVGFGGFMLYQNKMKTSETVMEKETILETETTVIEKNTVILTLSEQNVSGQSGTATLTEVDGKVTVTIDTTGAMPGVAQPAHIHVGACPTVGAVKYPLTSLTEGKSVTYLDVSMDTLMTQLPLGINVHKSAAESTVYVACGDIIAP